MSMSTAAENSLEGMALRAVRCALPPLSFAAHKGQAARVLVVGGCREYAGAPYYAGMAALRAGADLCHIMCAPEAAGAIKTYSPELIVLPSLDEENENSSRELETWLPRVHCLVVGPGLGRSASQLNPAAAAVSAARHAGLPIILDADALHLITQMPQLIQGYPRAILTPNIVEFRRLFTKLFETEIMLEGDVIAVRNVAAVLGNVTIIKKGAEDVISDGRDVLICRQPGSPRRCGGQGDVLSGCLAPIAHWTHTALNINDCSKQFSIVGGCHSPTLAAAYAACTLTRRAAHRAFCAKGRAARSTLVTDILAEIGEAFADVLSEAQPLL